MLGYGAVPRSGRDANVASISIACQPPPVFCRPRRWAPRRRPTGVVHAPAVLRAQGAAVKLGVLHPVSGALSYSGQQGRLGAMIAIEEINAAGGIKALSGAKIEAMLGDAQSTPEGGNAEVEKMNSAGVAAIVGGYASSICLAASQAAARYDLPYMVDVGVADSIVTRGLKNTFRFGPGFGVIAKTALDNLVTINDQAGKPAKTVMIVHEDSLFGSGLAKLLNAQLPRARLPGAGDHPASDPDPRLQQRRAQDQGAEPRPRDPGQLLQRIRPARPHHAAAAGAAEGHLLGARRRGLLLQVRQGIPRGRAIHHGLQSLVRPAQPQGAGAEEEGRGEGPVLHLRGVHELLVRPAAGRRDRARRQRRPRQDHRGAGELDLRRPRDALRADQIRQRPEPGRRAGQHPGARQRHPGDLPGRRSPTAKPVFPMPRA